MKLLHIACIAGAALALTTGAAFGQEATGDWTTPLANTVVTIVGLIVGAGVAAGVVYLKAKYNIDLQKFKIFQDAELSAGLIRAAENMTRGALYKLGLKPGEMPSLAQVERVQEIAVTNIRASNPDAVEHFKLSTGKLREMVLNQIPKAVAIIEAAKPAKRE